MMMAAQLKRGSSGLVSEDIIQARKSFDLQMQSIKAKPTPVKQVEDLRLPLHSGTIFARHYHPAPTKKIRSWWCIFMAVALL